jgi:glutathione synthase/RimK-type ligase-like ATP-grasp enzyme
MILFCGIPTERPLQLAIEAAGQLGVEHAVCSQRELAWSAVMLEQRGRCLTGRLWIREREWPLEIFDGVYTRTCSFEELPDSRAPIGDSRRERAEWMHRILHEWLEIAPCRVVNRARAMASNISKPYQAQIIARHFSTPPTCITNDPEEFHAFLALHGRVVYKSISSVRSIVREWRLEDQSRLHRIRVLPTQFQAYVPGVNVRVHVVGHTVFATRIDSEAVDYRYAGRDGLDWNMAPCDLPEAVADRCRAVSRDLDLPFCGIDLKLTPEGDYVCFEANPSPAYSYYQDNTGQPIAEALVRYLAGAIR